MDGYEALAGSLWTELFQLYELEEIVRQKSDPEFAKILERIRIGDMTEDDEKSLLQLENTDTSDFGPDTIHIFMYNRQVDAFNEEHVKALNDLITIEAYDSRRDKNTNTVCVSIPETSINNTANLPKILTIAPGAKVMLTRNIDIQDHLVNGIIGIVRAIDTKENKLKGTIFVDFGEDKIGQNAKLLSPRHLRNCVPIKAVTSSFLLQKPCTISVERTMYPIILAYAITSHKSQGSTYRHVVADLTLPETVKTVFPGQVYTILSRVTSRQGLKLINFNRQKLRVNTDALKEMKEMRSTRNFIWIHPIPDQPHTVAFLNIRSLPAHLADLQADPAIQRLSVLCLLETNLKNRKITMENFHIFHENTHHGLAIVVKKDITSRPFHLPDRCDNVELLCRLLQFDSQEVLIICVYKPPTLPKQTFICQLLHQLKQIKPCSIILGGDFNMEPHECNISNIASHLSLVQKIDQPTHTHGRTLDHIYVPQSFQHHSVGAFPVPYTDHCLTWIHI